VAAPKKQNITARKNKELLNFHKEMDPLVILFSETDVLATCLFSSFKKTAQWALCSWSIK